MENTYKLRLKMVYTTMVQMGLQYDDMRRYFRNTKTLVEFASSNRYNFLETYEYVHRALSRLIGDLNKLDDFYTDKANDVIAMLTDIDNWMGSEVANG